MRKAEEKSLAGRDAASIARFCAQALDRYKLERIEIVEVLGSLQIADYFVVGSASNQRHLRAAGDGLRKDLREAGMTRWGIEGYGDARWVLVDLVDVVVHLFVEESRRYYDLDSLWGDCPRLSWRPPGSRAADEGASAGKVPGDGVPGSLRPSERVAGRVRATASDGR